MIKPAELFAKLTCGLEDLHAIAIEGQAPDHPNELLLVLVNQSCNGLHRCSEIIAQIKATVGGV